MKRLTLILPDSVDILDITYYWRTEVKKKLVKSYGAFDCKQYGDMTEINCCAPVEEENDGFNMQGV